MTLSPVLEFSPFSPADSLVFSGAEPFPDGSEPRIASLEIDGAPAVAILDATGLALVRYDREAGDDGNDETPEYALTLETEEDPDGATPSDIRRALALLSPETTSIALEALGFRRSDSGGPVTVRATLNANYADYGAPWNRV
jgi:hypothetical protein